MEDDQQDVWMDEAVEILAELSEVMVLVLDRKLPKHLEKRVQELLLRSQDVIVYHENTLH